MRLKGTKYDSVDNVPSEALPVSMYAKKKRISSPAYVHIKYDRFKFGYKKANSDTIYKGENPGYSIVCFHGTNYVIPEQ